jgi:hypothetical protein
MNSCQIFLPDEDMHLFMTLIISRVNSWHELGIHKKKSIYDTNSQFIQDLPDRNG